MTDFVGEVEQELIDATNFKPERNYRDRQKYLGALLRACAGLSDDEFDKLSDQAADWCNEAAGANKDGYEIPDFKTNGDVHEQSEIIGAERTARIETKQDTLMDEATVEASTGNPTEDDGNHIDVPKTKKKGGRPKGSKTKKASVPVKIAFAKPKAKKPRTPRPTAAENIARKAVMGVNEWQVTIGCKADIACKLAAQENGASMKEIREATGGNKYNLFNRLQKNGYDIKFTNGRIYLAKPVFQQVMPLEVAPESE